MNVEVSMNRSQVEEGTHPQVVKVCALDLDHVSYWKSLVLAPVLAPHVSSVDYCAGIKYY